MGFNRIEAKFRAKASIRQARLSPMKVTLVYLLLTSLLSEVVRYLTIDPSALYADLYLWGYTAEEILSYLGTNYAGQMAIYSVASFVLGIYTTVMSFGYTSYALRLSRNEEPELTHIFDGFVKFWRVLWMAFLKGLFTTLWTLLGCLPGYVALVVYILTADQGADPYGVMSSTVGLMLLIMVLAVVAAAIASYRYCLAEYFLLDDPNRTARECIRMSKKAMKGWKMERFTLDFSFFGWVLLGGLVVGALNQIWFVVGLIGMLAFYAWFWPYRSVTEANFYNSVIGRTDPFQKDSDWEDRMKDFNEAFDKPEF